MLPRALLILSAFVIGADALGAQEQVQPSRRQIVFLDVAKLPKPANVRPSSVLQRRLAVLEEALTKEGTPGEARPALEQRVLLRDAFGIPMLIWAPIRPTVVHDGRRHPADPKAGAAR